MPKSAKPSSVRRPQVAGMEPICVTAFRDLSFLFPNDLFVLASWIAMSDLATSTPTGHRYTTIHGLTRKFQDLTGVAAEQVSDFLADHGICTNCNLVLPEDVGECGSAADRLELNRTDDRVAKVTVSEAKLVVGLTDGRDIAVPLAWYPRLLHATAKQRDHWEIAGGGYGIHWPDIDEDLSVEGLLAGDVRENRRSRSSVGWQRNKRGRDDHIV